MVNSECSMAAVGQGRAVEAGRRPMTRWMAGWLEEMRSCWAGTAAEGVSKYYFASFFFKHFALSAAAVGRRDETRSWMGREAAATRHRRGRQRK